MRTFHKRRAGLSATAGLSCYPSYMFLYVTVAYLVAFCVCLNCDRDVHVIEVTGSREVTSRGHVVRVIVRAGTRRRRHVVLLLQVHDQSAMTYIGTEGLRGTLDVVVSVFIICVCYIFSMLSFAIS